MKMYTRCCYISWGKNKFCLPEFFQNAVSCALSARWKAFVSYDHNQTYSDVLNIVFLSQMNRQCHVILKQC